MVWRTTISIETGTIKRRGGTGNKRLIDAAIAPMSAPALIVFAIIAVYFVIFMKFLGGTPWQRLLGVR